MPQATFTGMVLICARCLAEGRIVTTGTPVDNNNPPFAVVVADGDSLCSDHLTNIIHDGVIERRANA